MLYGMNLEPDEVLVSETVFGPKLKFPAITVWSVEQAGCPTTFFESEETARRYSAEQFDYNFDGIPFITKHTLCTKKDILDLLNKGAP